MSTSETERLVTAALVLHPQAPDEARALLAKAARGAADTRDRQLVVIASAHLAGDDERVDALARDHLADHPDSVLVAWLAAHPSSHPESHDDDQ